MFSHMFVGGDDFDGAYFRDTEENKLCVACHTPEPAAA